LRPFGLFFRCEHVSQWADEERLICPSERSPIRQGRALRSAVFRTAGACVRGPLCGRVHAYLNRCAHVAMDLTGKRSIFDSPGAIAILDDGAAYTR